MTAILAHGIAALVAGVAALVGYFGLVPGTYDLFTEFGRARGTFKDPNVLGAFLVPALLYAFNEVMSRTSAREPMAGADADPAARVAAILLTRSLDQFWRCRS